MTPIEILKNLKMKIDAAVCENANYVIETCDIKNINETLLSYNNKSFQYYLEKAMGYAYASAVDGVGRNEAQKDFKKYRDDMLAEINKTY